MPSAPRIRHSCFAFVFAFALSCAAADTPSGIRFDGLYCAPDDEGFLPPVTSYLRFYPDGVVVSVAARDTPQEAAKWIRRDDRFSSQGRYSFVKRAVAFSVTNVNGAVDYSGTLDGDQLAVSWDARNGKKGKDTYKFLRLALPTQ